MTEKIKKAEADLLFVFILTNYLLTNYLFTTICLQIIILSFVGSGWLVRISGKPNMFNPKVVIPKFVLTK